MTLAACTHSESLHALAQASRLDRYYTKTSLAVLVALVAVSPLDAGGTTHYAALVQRLLILILVGLFLWQSITAGLIEVRRSACTLPVGCFLLWGLLSVGWSPYRHQSMQWLMVLLGYGLLLYVSTPLLAAQRRLTSILAVLVIVGVGEALWGAKQVLMDGAIRPNGSFFNPNFFAGYLAAICIIPLALLCNRELPVLPRNAWYGSLLGPLGAAVALVTMGAMVVLAGSRGATVGWAVGIAVVLLARFGKRAVLVMIGIAVVVAVVPNPLQHRVLMEHQLNPVSYARVDIWKSSLRMILDHPNGIGLGLYQYVFPQYAFPLEHHVVRYGTTAQYPHSEVLQITAELGVIGAGLFAWGLCVVFTEARRAWMRTGQDSPGWLVVAVIGCMTVTLVHGVVDSNLHEPPIAIMLTLCVAMLTALSGQGKAAGPPYRFTITRRVRWALVSSVLLTVFALGAIRAGVAWLYYEKGSRALEAHDFQAALDDFYMATWLDHGKALYQSARAATHFQRFVLYRDARDAIYTVNGLVTARQLNPLDGRLAALEGEVFVTLATSLDRSAPDATAQRQSFLEQAARAYREALVREPFSAAYAFELGRVEQALGDDVQAEQIVKRSLEMEPNFLPAREWLIRMYVRRNDVEEAMQEYQQIVARHSRISMAGRGDALAARYAQVDVSALHALLSTKKES